MTPHTLHITHADLSRRGAVGRGIRDALRVCGMADGAEIIAAVEERIALVLAGEMPVGIAALGDEAVIIDALHALERGSYGAAVGAVDLSDEEKAKIGGESLVAQAPETTPDATAELMHQKIGDGEEISMEAIQTSLLLLATNGGNLPLTYAQARTLARVTGDPELYTEVVRLYVTTFDLDMTGT